MAIQGQQHLDRLNRSDYDTNLRTAGEMWPGMMMPSTQSLGARREEKEFISLRWVNPGVRRKGQHSFANRDALSSATWTGVGPFQWYKILIASISTTLKPCYPYASAVSSNPQQTEAQNSLMLKSTPRRRTKIEPIKRLKLF